MKKLLVTVLIIVSLATGLLTGCITITTATPTAEATSTSTMTATVDTTPIDPEWTPSICVDENTALPSVADVVALVKPSVVSINIEVPVTGFFGTTTEQGSGSGWILDADGIVVTNYHVIEGATSITVTLDDERSFIVDAQSVFTDPANDLAILEIDADNLPALAIGDSSGIRVGDWVVAIGNSLGRGTRATVGIVSQLGVTLQLSDSQTLYNLIDTSAVINPGNSGGPLVNMAGEVVGITSAKIVATGAEATGFAISSQEAAPIIKALVNNGYVIRPFLGVQNLTTVNQAVASYYRLKINYGVLVRGIVIGGPAEEIGMQAGDIITSIGGETVESVQELTKILYAATIGEPLAITYWRDNGEVSATITPVESPPPAFS